MTQTSPSTKTISSFFVTNATTKSITGLREREIWNLMPMETLLVRKNMLPRGLMRRFFLPDEGSTSKIRGAKFLKSDFCRFELIEGGLDL